MEKELIKSPKQKKAISLMITFNTYNWELNFNS
jgi:hypothetical protein